MNMRCKSCETIMTGDELNQEKPDGTQEDLCSSCLKKVYLDIGKEICEDMDYDYV